MRKIIAQTSILVIFLIAILNTTILAQFPHLKQKKLSLLKLQKNDYDESVIDVGNITSWVSAEGFHNWVFDSHWNGAYPNGDKAGVVFSEGIVWGALVYDGQNQKVRVNGNTYGSGCKPITRLYRVRSDYKTANLKMDASNYFKKPIEKVSKEDIKKLRDLYEKDWNEWPSEEGAIYMDVNNDGKYEPKIDIPGVPGATQTIFIKYDDSDSENLYQSKPIGLEVTETYWGYNYTGTLGEAIFKKVDIVYKGTSKSAANSYIDSMYICQWSDTDLGNWSDDLAGCDTVLNLGYTYNGESEDKVYSSIGMPPPAAGYVFLNGVSKYTGNPQDSAIINFKWRKGYKYVNHKPMSSFIHDASGNTWVTPEFSYNGALEYYSIMRGRLPSPRYPRDSQFPDSYGITTPFGTYLLYGDPVTGTGIIDGTIDIPSDRVLYLMTGPFKMNLNDTVETFIALVGGEGNSYLNSITELKQNVKRIQKFFNRELRVPKIQPPEFKVTGLDSKVILEWGLSQQGINRVENFSMDGYNFEGYEIYQLPSKTARLEEGVKIGNYDLVNGVTAIYDTIRDFNYVKIPELRIDGKDNGLVRYITVTRDSLKHKKLVNGQEYYFTVVSYGYNPSPIFLFHSIQSTANIKMVIPQIEPPGIRYGAELGDTLLSMHSGQSEGKLFPIVINPKETDGKTYQITFDTLNKNIVWNLKEKNSGTILIENQINQKGDNDYPVIRGILPKVISPPKGIKKLEFKGDTWIYIIGWGGNQLYGRAVIGDKFWNRNEGIYKYLPVELRFTGGSGSEVPSEENGWSQGAVYRKDKNYEYSGIGWMPFTAWDISDSLNPVQLNVSFVEDSIEGNANLKWDLGWNGSKYPFSGGNEYILISNTLYNPSFYNQKNNATQNGNMYFIWPLKKGGNNYLANKFSIIFIPNKINLPGDVFEFTAPKVKKNNELAKEDVEKINVFPNPYYKLESNIENINSGYVTFSHLPEEAIIRIFDISGVLVRTIHHKKTSGQFERWDLKNDYNKAVASGIYIINIDMPELGKTKILKFALVH